MIREFAKKLNIFLLVICIIALQFGIIGSAEITYPSFAVITSNNDKGYTTLYDKPGTPGHQKPGEEKSKYVTDLYDGEKVKLYGTGIDGDGDMWYKVGFGVNYLNIGYVYEKRLTPIGYYTTDSAFEAKLTEQNFPESYKVKLRELHFLYPNWQFVAENINMNFADAVAGETANPGTKLVSPSRDESWRSTNPNTYDAATGTWETYDGNWYSASKTVVEYFMDPRNMLDYKTVFVFSPHSYNEKFDTDESLKKILSGTFMSDALQDDPSKTYFDVLKKAGKDKGVSPLAMAAKFIQEQGSNGAGKCITGETYKGYTGIYNFFNVGAYADSKRDTIERGLWWASGESSNKTSYGRPWNTREKSITGGAEWYAESYVKVGQDSYYYMNFNVKGSNPFTHQYATNIEDAASKARLVSKGYTGLSDLEIVFYIPVYKNMPDSTTLPSAGSNDNYLKSLVIEGHTDKYRFDMHTNVYELMVPYEQSKVKITAVPNNASATISGVGEIELQADINEIEIVVTAASGDKRIYTILIERKKNPTTEIKKPTLEGSYKTGTYLTGVEPKTAIATFTSKIGVKNGSIKLFTAAGAEKKTGYIGTGDKVSIYNVLGALEKTYTIMILGDCDGDGEIKTRDLLLGQRSILKLQALSGVYATAMDIDKDGSLKSRDLLLGQRHILKLATIKQ